MVDAIKTFGEHSKEYGRLMAAATLMNTEMDADDREGHYEIDTIYFDYGNGWKWTTIVFRGGDQWSSYQALNPLHQGMIVYGDLQDFTRAVWEVVQKRKDRHSRPIKNFAGSGKHDVKGE